MPPDSTVYTYSSTRSFLLTVYLSIMLCYFCSNLDLSNAQLHILNQIKKTRLCFNFPMLISVMNVLKTSIRLLWLGTGSWCPQNLGSCRANEQLLPLTQKGLIALQHHLSSFLARTAMMRCQLFSGIWYLFWHAVGGKKEGKQNKACQLLGTAFFRESQPKITKRKPSPRLIPLDLDVTEH